MPGCLKGVAVSEPTVYAIGSGKGGVGKTTTAVNLAVALVSRGYEVGLVDADLGMPDVGRSLGLAREPTIQEVLAGAAAPGAAIHDVSPVGLSVVPGGSDLGTYARTEPGQLRAVLDALVEDCDVVLLDVGAGISHEAVLPFELADGTLLITTPEPAAMDDVERAAELVDHAGGEVVGLVLTRARDDADVDIAATLDPSLVAAIPEDDAVRRSVHAESPVIGHEPDAPAAIAYRQLAARVVGETYEGPTIAPAVGGAVGVGTDDPGDDAEADLPVPNDGELLADED
ncbi:septum site-determining protein MinD [Halobacteriales archaeon SW_7_68_16]|nr:MAG: septum site-determining protein MinD [Halobacteriales archaeon SW_7_68_16]